MIAEPSGEFVFGQFTRGEGQNNACRVLWVECQCMPVVRQKQTRKYPRCAFVAIGNRRIPRNSISISRSQCSGIVCAIIPLVYGSS